MLALGNSLPRYMDRRSRETTGVSSRKPGCPLRFGSRNSAVIVVAPRMARFRPRLSKFAKEALWNTVGRSYWCEPSHTAFTKPHGVNHDLVAALSRCALVRLFQVEVLLGLFPWDERLGAILGD